MEMKIDDLKFLKEKNEIIRVDMSNIEFINSTQLGSIALSILNNNNNITLYNVDRRMSKIFKIIGMDTIKNFKCEWK